MEYEEYLTNDAQFNLFIQKQKHLNPNLGTSVTIKVAISLQQEMMALLNIVDMITIKNYPLSHLKCLTELVGKLGGIYRGKSSYIKYNNYNNTNGNDNVHERTNIITNQVWNTRDTIVNCRW